MAYTSEEKQEVLGAVKVTEFTELRVTSIKDENDSVTAVDIRNWYHTQKDPVMKPSKGVRVRSENLADLIDLLIKSADSNTIKELHNKGINFK